jgi:hypothetical protein
MEINQPLDRCVPVTTAWRVLSLRMEERPPIWRVTENKLSSRGGPKRAGHPAWGLGVVLTIPHCKNISCYKMFTQKNLLPGLPLGTFFFCWLRIAQVVCTCECSNEPSGSIQGGEFLDKLRTS